jgi:nitroreductase
MKPESGTMPDVLLSCLAARRHVALRRLVAPGPDAADLTRIAAAAAQAPDHGRLRPWRLILIPQDKRAALGEAFADALVRRDPDAGEAERRAAFDKAFHAPCLLVVVLAQRRDTPAVPREEQLVALGCAVQNALLAAGALGFASGLASGAAMDAPGMRVLLRLAPHERAILFIGIGTAASEKPPRARPDAAAVLSVL